MTSSLLHPIRMLCILLAFVGTLVANIPADYTHITCDIKPSTRASHRHTHPRIPFSRDPKEADSTNWSGYVALPNFTNPTPHSVTKVSGSWIVPHIQPSVGDTYCAIWVGIDGSGGSTTVEQIGTSHDVVNGQLHHSAWYEMYPQGSNDIVGFPIEAGDTISASVVYAPCGGVLPVGQNLFILQLINNTKKVYTTIPYITLTNMARLCAEWIVEAPYMNEILPLTNFGTIHLSNCLAKINNILGSISNAAWVNESMNMVATDGSLKAVTSPLSADGKSFSVAWKHT